MRDLFSKMGETGIKVDRFISQVIRINRKPTTLYRAARHIIDAGGKRLRPFIVLKSSRVVGGLDEDAIPAAAAVELLHTFSLIHDDIMDRDDTRRGVETVHTKWGVPTAILSGDLLFAKVFEIVGEFVDTKLRDSRRTMQILKLLVDASTSICEGQAMDMEFELKREVTEEDYLTMISGKTAKLFEVSAKIGGIVGGGSERDIESLGLYGYNAGMAFQIIDDILGLTAEEENLGKPVGSDIREGKMTLIIINALKSASVEDRSLIIENLGKESANEEVISSVIDLLLSLGSIDYAREVAERYASSSKRALAVFKESREKRDLIDIIDLVVSRRR